MYSTFNGLWNSSTRCELAAALIAMLAEGPIHIASDSQAMLSKAEVLRQKAIDKCDEIVEGLDMETDTSKLEEHEEFQKLVRAH